MTLALAQARVATGKARAVDADWADALAASTIDLLRTPARGGVEESQARALLEQWLSLTGATS